MDGGVRRRHRLRSRVDGVSAAVDSVLLGLHSCIVLLLVDGEASVCIAGGFVSE
jgi:hypothetical protein